MRRAAVIIGLLVVALYGLWRLADSRTYQLFGTIIPRVETTRRVVALTFDDGPRSDTLDEILTPLAKANAKATFFVCGAEMRSHPGVAEKLVAAGHELGNHSYSHPRMVLKSQSFIRDELARTDAIIRAAGHHGPIHFRAPYCKKLVGLPWYLAKTNRTHVTWDVEPETDPKIDRDMQAIVAHVVENVRPGSIVLLHPWYQHRERTRAALPLILARLKAQGYELVTVDQLLKMRRT